MRDSSLSSVDLNWLGGAALLLLFLLGHILLLLRLFLFAWLVGTSRWRGGGLLFLLVSLALTRLRLELLLTLTTDSGLVERHWLHHLLLVHHVWWEVVVLTLVAHWHWRGSHVLIWVESTKATRKCSQLSEVGDLDHRGLLLWELSILLSSSTIKVLVSIIVSISALVVVVLHLLWHWRKSNTLWKVWKWVDELSSFLLSVVEGASLTKLALTFAEEVLAWLSLIVWVDSSESGLAKVLWEWLN